MPPSRDELLLLAKVAEQAERYDDMREFMDGVAFGDQGSELTLEERQLLSNAYKVVSGRLRRTWRTINGIEEREASKKSSPFLHLVRRRKSEVLSRLGSLCREILDKVEHRLLPSATTPESKVFYYKIIGDYYRYLAESSEEDTRKKLVTKSLENYKTAWELAEEHLPKTDPTRLGLALNFSVFYFELFNSPERACHLAKHAFDSAVENLDDLPEDDAGDTIHILQLLKDNLSLWMGQMGIFPPPDQTETPVQA